MDNKVIKQESVVNASSAFLMSDQSEKNRIIDKMFDEQPSLFELMK